MKKARWIFWVVAGLVVAAAAVLLSPRSPYYLPDWWVTQAHYQGQSARYWVRALDSSDQETRHQAIFALGAIGSEAGDAVPKLAVIMIEDEDRIARAQASLALSKMIPASESVVEALAQALEDRELIVRMNAAMTLFRLREKARPAVTTLIRCMRDDSNVTNLAHFPVTIQQQMVLTLGRVSAGSDEAVLPLSEALKGAGNDGMRWAAVRALGFVGADAKSALPLIRALLESPNERLRHETEAAISKIERPVKRDA